MVKTTFSQTDLYNIFKYVEEGTNNTIILTLNKDNEIIGFNLNINNKEYEVDRVYYMNIGYLNEVRNSETNKKLSSRKQDKILDIVKNILNEGNNNLKSVLLSLPVYNIK